MDDEKFENFLKISCAYGLKKVVRNTSNCYFDAKSDVQMNRKETTAEHVYSSLKLADYFLSNEDEFKELDRVRVYELLMYHDDVEIETGDVGISEREKRKNKQEEEKNALPILASKYPNLIDKKLVNLDKEYRESLTLEAKFAKSIDKMDAMIHELEYPQDWGPKGFDEKNTLAWFEPSMVHSVTFKMYFDRLIVFLRENGYFEKEVSNVNKQLYK